MSGADYRSRNERRRARLLAGVPLSNTVSLNGIDYVELVNPSVAAAWKSLLSEYDGELSWEGRVLRVRFLRTDSVHTLTRSAIVITGGRRVPTVAVQALLGPPPEALGLAFDPCDLWVLVAQSGDFSTYTLSLVNEDTGDGPPVGFDRVLSRAELNFKLDCPTDLDCMAPATPQPGTPSLQNIDYLGRDYESFRTLMLDRMSTLADQWTERHPADLGVALVEAIAHVADGLSYYQDAVATEAYLATARQRVSVRRHARLLDYTMHEGCSARVLVFVEVKHAEQGRGAAEGRLIPSGTPLLTRVDDLPPGGLSASAAPDALLSRPLVFETLHDLVPRRLHNALRVHTWGEDDAVLAAGSTSAVLAVSAEEADGGGGLSLRAGDVLVFVEQYAADPDDSTRASKLSADPRRRHAVRLLTAPVDLGADPVTEMLLYEISWHPRDALPFDVCLHVWDLPPGEDPQQGAPSPVQVVASVALGNLVLADHGRTFVDDPLPAPEDGAIYRPALQRRGLAHTVAYDPVAGASEPVVETLRVDPTLAAPAVVLTGDGHTWTARRDLLQSDRFAEEFVVEMHNDRRATLRFGDGVHGRAPNPSAALTPSYRVGGGTDGNIAAGGLAHIVLSDDHAEGIAWVSNPLPARGGVEPEPVSQVKLLAPHAFKRQQRAVRPEDYAEIAQRHPEVQRAVAHFRWTGSWRTVWVTVDRLGGLDVDAAFQAELVSFLEPYRMAGHELRVAPPLLVPLHITLPVRVQPDRLASEVENVLRSVFSDRVQPDGSLGFFHPDRLSFGQTLYVSQIVARAMAVEGVVRVDVTPGSGYRFERLHRHTSSGVHTGRLRFGPLEVPMLSADPNAPERGRFELLMSGGL